MCSFQGSGLQKHDQTKTLKPPHGNRETNPTPHKHTQTLTNTNTNTNTHTNTHKHTQIHTNTHQHTQTHTNTSRSRFGQSRFGQSRFWPKSVLAKVGHDLGIVFFWSSIVFLLLFFCAFVNHDDAAGTASWKAQDYACCAQ